MAEEQEQHLAQLRSELADRLLLNRQRLEEEHATLVEAQAQVRRLSPAIGLLPTPPPLHPPVMSPLPFTYTCCPLPWLPHAAVSLCLPVAAAHRECYFPI